MKSAKGGVIKFLSTALLVLVLLAVVGFLAYFTRGFTGDFKTFYIETDDSRILSDREMALQLNREQRFNTKYTFGFLAGNSPTGYSVKVIPNVAVKDGFEYRVDGKKYQFGAEPEFTPAFAIEQSEDYFTVKFTMQTMAEAIQALYPDNLVEDVPEIDLTEAAYFLLVVTSYNGEAEIKIALRLDTKVAGVVIEPGEVIF